MKSRNQGIFRVAFGCPLSALEMWRRTASVARPLNCCCRLWCLFEVKFLDMPKRGQTLLCTSHVRVVVALQSNNTGVPSTMLLPLLSSTAELL